MNLFGSKTELKTVQEIIAPLKETMDSLLKASEQRATKIKENNQVIENLTQLNQDHEAEIHHAERVAEKLAKLVE